MDAFEVLLTEHRAAIERFVKYRIPTRADAIDTLIETALSYNRFGVSEDDAVGETLALLGDRDRQIYGDDCRKALRYSLCDGR